MDILPHSVEGAITLWGGVLVALVGVISRLAKAWRAAQDKRMQSVPPSSPAPRHSAVERRLDTLERVLAEQRQWREDELRAELAELQKTVADLTADLGRMSMTVSTERQRALRSEARLAVEIEQRRLLENRLAETTHAKERAERERDAAQRAVRALRER